MGILNSVGTAIDHLVGVVSPRRAILRARYRAAWSRSGTYAAARTTKSTGAWSPVGNNVNDLVGASSPAIRARVRQLVRDFPYFARALNILTDYVVGEGIVFQSKIEAAGGGLDHKRVQQVEDCFAFWADEADFAGRLHFYELMRLAKRQEAEAGEFLIVKREDRRPGRYLPYCLQMLEADWLTDNGAKPVRRDGSTVIVQGVEVMLDGGRPIAYHFTDPDSWGKATVAMAADVIHGFDTMRPNQFRGISAFAPGVLVADDLATLMDSELDASKMAAKWLAMVKTPDPLTRQLGVGVQEGDNGEPIEELENAIIEYLRPGEDVVLSSNPRPGANFPPFVRLVLCMFSVTTGIPYELLSGDYQGMNYSTGRTVRNDFRKTLRPHWMRHTRLFCIPAVRRFFDSAVLAGKLTLPGYWANPVPWLREEWQPPGMESTDPLRETKAGIDEVNALMRSPQEIIRSRGRDPEAVLREISEFKKLADHYGLTVAEVSTALANNPAALDAGKSEANGRTLDEVVDALDEILARS